MLDFVETRKDMDEEEKLLAQQFMSENLRSLTKLSSFFFEKIFDEDGKCDPHMLECYMTVKRTINNHYNLDPNPTPNPGPDLVKLMDGLRL